MDAKEAKARYLANMYGAKKVRKEKNYGGRVVDTGEAVSRGGSHEEGDVPVVVESRSAWFDLIHACQDGNANANTLANVNVNENVKVEMESSTAKDEYDISHTGLYIPPKLKRKSPSKFHQEAEPRPKEQTIHRDEFGKKIDMDALVRQQLELDEGEADRKAERLRVGRGLKQQELQSETRQRLHDEKTSKFAYYKDNIELNASLREIERFDDPMAKEYLSKGKKSKRVKTVTGYQGQWAPNRFSIPPGKGWDGVDRGNGFEVRLYQAKNTRKVKEDTAYSWSVEDM